MRIITSTLLAAQRGTAKVPYIRIVINSVDYSSRLLFQEYIEEPYRDRATLILRNNDRAFDAVDLTGRSFQIGHGYTTGATPATWAATTDYSIGDSVQPETPDGVRYYCIVAGISGGGEPSWPTIGNTVPDGTVTWEYGCASGNEYGMYPTVWVKSQQIVSSEGEVVCQLYCEGEWMYLREQYLIAFGTSDEPLYIATFDGTTYTVYDLIEMVIETAMGWTLNAAPSPDDGILTTLKPVFSVNVARSGNRISLDSAAQFLYDMITLTGCYLRQKASTTWEIVYPQDADSANESYYSDQTHYFYEYMEKINLTIPNRIIVAANNPDDLIPWPSPVVYGDTGAYTGNYVENMEIHLYPWITTEADADLVAQAIKARIKAEGLAGRLIVPHDCSVELYDKVAAYDDRGA